MQKLEKKRKEENLEKSLARTQIKRRQSRAQSVFVCFVYLLDFCILVPSPFG
jgi:hypothetical protein